MKFIEVAGDLDKVPYLVNFDNVKAVVPRSVVWDKKDEFNIGLLVDHGYMYLKFSSEDKRTAYMKYLKGLLLNGKKHGDKRLLD